MSDQPKTLTRPWRRFLRLSMHGLIVVVLLFGVWLGWLVRTARIQRDAVKAITAAGGLVKYNWGWTKANPTMVIKRADPGWLADLIGIDYVGHVTVVWLTASPSLSDATMIQVGHFTRLRQLRLDQSSIKDAWLEHLSRLEQLSSLNLDGTRVSDQGLAQLSPLKELSALYLDSTRVTDSGVDELQKVVPGLQIFR